MTAIGLVFTFTASLLLLTLPRRLAAIPLLMGTLYMTPGQLLEIGPAHLDVVRILVIVGFLRVVGKGESIAGGMNRIDRMLILWAAWLIICSSFHTSNAWVFRSGVVWTNLGSYFLFRIYIQTDEDIANIFKVLCVLLFPVAILMIMEKLTGKNYVAALGGVNDVADFRNGNFRAQGAFAHSILAGTVGAACFPMALYLWKRHCYLSLLGFLGAGGMVFATTSSGPVMMLLFIMFGLLLWNIRLYLRAFRWFALIAVIALDRIMEAPVYFLMARIDIAGGSTGFYRAQLIRSSIEHLDEWWLVGTDYTRHWMATGVPANSQHADITNHFLGMGVNGGLPLMFLFIIVLVVAFNTIGRALRENENAPTEHCFLIWTLGAILFGYVWNFFSISLFDQSIVFFHLILAVIGATQIAKSFAKVEIKSPLVRIKQSRYIANKGNQKL